MKRNRLYRPSGFQPIFSVLFVAFCLLSMSQIASAPMSDVQARAELDRVRKQTGLPATDPIRFGATVLLDAVV